MKNTIEGLRKFVTNQNTLVGFWIAFYDGEPFAYLITSTVDEEEAGDLKCHFAKWIEHGKKVRTFDLLIGEEKYLGKGLGAILIQELITTILADSDIVFIDPEATNYKATHVYEKVGFEKYHLA